MPVAQWLGHCICDREVTSSSPGQFATKYQLWASCSHLRSCVGASGLEVGVDS